MAKTETQLYEQLAEYLPAQLTAITVQLGLKQMFLPPENEAPATRAAAILRLAKGAGQLGALEKILGQASGGGAVAVPVADCILILAANPIDTDRLRLDKEVKVIKERLEEGERGRSYAVEIALAPSATDLSKLLLKHQPKIVHFSGHGSPTGEIVLEGAGGKAEAVRGRALAGLFDTLRGTELIVLNACYSDEQARTLAKVVPQVIGMSREIGDEDALRFAAGFYRGLAFGRDYATAFRLGCNEIDLAGLPDAVVPHFTTGAEEHIAAPAAEVEEAPVALERVRRSWRGLAPDDDDAPRLYTLWYGTNRKPLDAADASRSYSGERDEASVYYGQCQVAVPKSHKIGELGSPWWKRLLNWEDDRVKLTELTRLAEGAFWGSVRAALGTTPAGAKRVLVFIHGYNVSFEEAARRTAQLAADLNVPGLAAFYSWPSKASPTPLGYTADEASIEVSEGRISEFLTRLAAESGAERIDVLAHSMGNRGLLRALQRIGAAAAGLAKIPLGQLVLAAPDIDAALFRDLAKAYSLGQRTTLYVSSKDRALAASGIVHDHPRAGYTPPVTVIDGIDTIEVSNIDLTFLGHGYYAAARDLLHDMHELISYGAAPSARHGLRQAGGYWRIAR
jgi:esterase/lipase superfamily enzyme